VSRIKLVALMFALSMLVAAPASSAHKEPDRPSHVVIIVLDQARPDTITRYGMTNVQALQRKGENFKNAYVGHMAAETVISHNVLTSGQFPKHMGWTNEVYRDTNGVLAAPGFPGVGAPGDYYVTSSMSCAQFGRLIDQGGYKKLQDYLDDRFGQGSSFASISQKRTSACTSGHTSSAADGTPTDGEDIIFQIRGSTRITCDGDNQWRIPELITTVPRPYLNFTGTCADRWVTWQRAGAYRTGEISPANIYPLDGNRFVPGFDPNHLGGDTWSADAAIRFITNEEDWHGMMVSLGGIDKMGHMWGPEDPGASAEPAGSPGTAAEKEIRHMPFVAKNADVQVGRIIDALKAKEMLDDTLVVITADHAAQTGHPSDDPSENSFHGVLAEGVANPLCSNTPHPHPPTRPPSNGIRSDCNWYLGSDLDEHYEDPSPAVAALDSALDGNLAFSYQDTQVAAWLKQTTPAHKREAAEAVLDMPDVVASYYINAAQNDYRLYGTNRMTGAERSWFARHAGELVDTMAASNGPDVVGLTGTDVTYGVIGDHGGANQLVQRIPMIFYGGGVGSKDSNRDLRHVDVMPTILEAMGIPYDEDSLDGEAVRLSRSR
jgi:predicted AlkP superfamily pyrophosphatase or phosphodiesterase